MSQRKIIQIINGQQTTDGAGVKLKRFIGISELKSLDPFLMLDEFKTDSPNDYVAGFPNHPHRGFQTITYLLNGIMEHNDSMGNSGTLETGGVQWMNAGSGIVHSEMPKQKDGLLRGYQLWVNSPSHLKMMKSEYKDFLKPDWKKVTFPTSEIELLAGEIGEEKGLLEAKTPIFYSHWKLEENGTLEIDTQENWNGFLHIIGGKISIDGKEIKEGQLAVLGKGTKLKLENKFGSNSEGILVLGEPIGEPVVQYGPFVMNTEKEIYQAIEDFQNGRF